MAKPYDTEIELEHGGMLKIEYPTPLPEPNTKDEIRFFQMQKDVLADALKAYDECPCGQCMDACVALMHDMTKHLDDPRRSGVKVQYIPK